MYQTDTPLAVLVLNRIGFGPRPGDIEAFDALGDNDDDRLSAYVDTQLDPASIDDDDAEARIDRANYASTGQSRTEAWDSYVRNVDGNNQVSTPLEELRRLAMLRATYSERQLVEVLADFWHNHFNVFGEHRIARAMIMHYDSQVIRPHVLGNFRTLLGEVSRSSTMLYYLDNVASSDGGPNENFARELLELHTLGAENYLGAGLSQADVEGFPDAPVGYVDDDVYETTRAFTGWSVANGTDSEDTGEFLFRRTLHDRFQKTVLGTFIRADQGDNVDGEQVLDILAQHPGTARHLSRKLCRRLVADDPPEELVESTAEVFTSAIDDDDQIAQVVRHIVMSDQFRTSVGLKAKRPFEATTAFLRATGAELSFGPDDEQSTRFVRLYNEMGQQLFGWPAPDGFPDSARYWLNTNSLFKRWRLVNASLASAVDGNYWIDVYAATPREVRTADGVVDFWLRRILGFEVADATRRSLVEFMAQGFDPSFDLGDSDSTISRIRALVSMVFMIPEYQQR
jgi:uncharacterized protein (DUF1800 family)